MAEGCRSWNVQAGGLRYEQLRRFIDELKEDVKLVGMRGDGRMVAGDWL